MKIFTKLLFNTRYLLFLRLIISGIILVSFLGLNIALFKNFEIASFWNSIFSIIISVFANVSYFLILVVVWKKR